jgi:hypothetical protein
MTYLRQDFSVTQPVDDADPWPSQQRFDYLVWDRPAPAQAPLPEKTSDETDNGAKSVRSFPQRESVVFALRALTGKDAGTTSDAWRSAVSAAP